MVALHFWLRDTVGPPDHMEPTGAFLDFGSDHLGHPSEVALCHWLLIDHKVKCLRVWVGILGASRTGGGQQKSDLGGEYERGRALHLD